MRGDHQPNCWPASVGPPGFWAAHFAFPECVVDGAIDLLKDQISDGFLVRSESNTQAGELGAEHTDELLPSLAPLALFNQLDVSPHLRKASSSGILCDRIWPIAIQNKIVVRASVEDHNVLDLTDPLF